MEIELIKKIIESYEINGSLKDIKTKKGYPHIQKISFDEDYIIKKIKKIYCKDINTLYDYLSQSDYVELPMKTIDGNYGLSYNDELYILYPRLKKFKGKMASFWWAKALESIHQIPFNENDFDNEYTIDTECFTLLNEANGLFSDKVKKQINDLLSKYYNDAKVNKMVLSHGDPYDSNVMNNKTYLRLIDTDGARLLPKEFDIGRLFYNEVIREKDLDEIYKYINIFFYNYRDKVDINLLQKIYVMDLLRTFSWLNLVTRDKSRADYARQIEELKNYKESILSERHQKVLKKL